MAVACRTLKLISESYCKVHESDTYSSQLGAEIVAYIEDANFTVASEPRRILRCMVNVGHRILVQVKWFIILTCSRALWRLQIPFCGICIPSPSLAWTESQPGTIALAGSSLK